MTSIAAGQAETLRLNVGDVIGSERYDRGPVSSRPSSNHDGLGFVIRPRLGHEYVKGVPF